MNATTRPHDLGQNLWLDSITINTMPEETLLALADPGRVREPLPASGGNAEDTLATLARVGVDTDALATEVQREGANAFIDSWNKLMRCLESKSSDVLIRRSV